MNEQFENYLAFNLNTLKIIKQKIPVFIIKRMKNNFEFGG